MKLISSLTTGLLAVAALLLAAPASQAAVRIQQGDLVLGFRTQDSSVKFDFLIDLGLASDFTKWALNNAGQTISLNQGGTYFGNAGGLNVSDLVKVYGANWNTQSGLVFSVAGSDVDNNLFATFKPGVTPKRASSSTQGVPANTIGGVVNGIDGAPNTFNNGTTTVNLSSPQATTEASGSDGSFSSIIANSSNKDYGYFAATTEGAVPSSGSSNLNFFKLAPGSATLPGQNLGTFSLGSNGNFTFTAAPEPGSVMLLGISAMTLLFRRRRNAAVQA